MYVGTETLITLRILSNLMAQKWPPGVSRDCTICRTEGVINTKRNRISEERGMKSQPPKTTI